MVVTGFFCAADVFCSRPHSSMHVRKLFSRHTYVFMFLGIGEARGIFIDLLLGF